MAGNASSGEAASKERELTWDSFQGPPSRNGAPLVLEVFRVRGRHRRQDCSSCVRRDDCLRSVRERR
jgi:hypothetical protein